MNYFNETIPQTINKVKDQGLRRGEKAVVETEDGSRYGIVQGFDVNDKDEVVVYVRNPKERLCYVVTLDRVEYPVLDLS